MDTPSAIIFYDGVCGLCNRLNPFVLERDRKGVFRFAPFQSEFARNSLQRYGVYARDAAMLYVLVEAGLPSERLLARAEAALFVLNRLSGVWKVLSLLGILPDWLLNAVYDLIARNRYKLLGRYESCPVPLPEWRDRFIEAGASFAPSQPRTTLLD